MRQENQSLSFHEKTSDLRKMHKNRQNSVDFISDIRLQVGMDARTLKKYLLAEMLLQYQSIWESQDEDAKRESAALTMDIDTMQKRISEAQYRRYLRVMDQLVDEAQDKL